jgi:hypothetical protein
MIELVMVIFDSAQNGGSESLINERSKKWSRRQEDCETENGGAKGRTEEWED